MQNITLEMILKFMREEDAEFEVECDGEIVIHTGLQLSRSFPAGFPLEYIPKNSVIQFPTRKRGGLDGEIA